MKYKWGLISKIYGGLSCSYDDGELCCPELYATRKKARAARKSHGTYFYQRVVKVTMGDSDAQS